MSTTPRLKPKGFPSSKNMNKITSTFNGSVEDFLNHCSKLNPDLDLDALDEANEEAMINQIMSSENVDRNDAEFIYDEFCNYEIGRCIDSLVEKGLIHSIETDETGEPKYSLTDKGRDMIKTI